MVWKQFPPYPYNPTQFPPAQNPKPYDPTALLGKQSPVPSQDMPVPPPFDPRYQPDVFNGAPPDVVDIGIVRSVFDSRPVNAFDFHWEETYNGTSAAVHYTVPQGYLAITRRFEISVYPAVTNTGVHTLGINGYGDAANPGSPANANLQILINGAPTPYWTPNTLGFGGVPTFDLEAADLAFNAFVLVDENQTLSIAIPGVTNDGSTITYVHYYGNLIRKTGRTLNNEVGNGDPELVETLTEYEAKRS
jgi:hypothetical protein